MAEDERIPVLKTWKLFVKGAFPRSESGRTLALHGPKGELLAHLSHASRKDLRDAVEAARAAFPAWSGATAYLRGQIIYRLAEMLEGRRADLADGIRTTTGASRRKAESEVDRAIDRTVSWAGWCDKFQMVLGSRNPVAGPYHNFSMPEPGGVCVALQAEAGATPLLGFMSLVLPPLCAGNAVVAVADARHPLGALLVAESAPTADVPAGALNVLTGQATELASWVAGHRDVDSIHAHAAAEVAAVLRAGAAENLKRVKVLEVDEDFGDEERWTNPRRLASFVETKTIWHPSGT
jgi:acyl-CoA reductase-like NAD-dependent aldehyde dehydrogenase